MKDGIIAFLLLTGFFYAAANLLVGVTAYVECTEKRENFVGAPLDPKCPALRNRDILFPGGLIGRIASEDVLPSIP